MRTPGCRWPVVVFPLFPAFFFLQACGGGSNSGQTPGQTVPSVFSLSPPSVSAGSGALTLTVTGTRFLADATVLWNRSALATRYVSATELTATVPADRIAASAYVLITVVNPGSSGGRSFDFTFTINNPAPLVTGITPSQIPARSNGIQISVNGSGFTRNSWVRWNATELPTTYVSGSQLTVNVPTANLVAPGTVSVAVVNPPPSGGTSTALVFTIGPPQLEGQNHVTSLNLLTTAMVWDPTRGRIYATLPGTTANGNSVVAIDPVTGTTSAPVFVGSEPNLLALSSDASHLWIGLHGANAIQRVTLPDLTPDLRIEIPPDSYYGPQFAIAIQPAPVNPDTLAVIPGNGRVVVYNGAVQQPTTVPTGEIMDWVQWGQDDGTLYGEHGYSVGVELHVMNVDASGVRLDTQYQRVFPDEESRGYYDRSTGRFYADDGYVFDPSTGVIPGTFNLRDFPEVDACLPDPVGPIVFCLGRDAAQYDASRGFTLRAFDKNTYRQLGNLQVLDAKGVAQNLIRWGRAGIAFTTKSGPTGDIGTVYFVDGAFISSSAEPDFTSGTPVDPLPVLTAMTPESAIVGSAGFVLTISGSEFQPSAIVYWNGEPLTTTFHSSTELQAVVPASKLALDEPATVSVANDTLSYAVNSLAFTILPASSGLIARNLSSVDIAWDALSARLYAPVWSADPRYANSVVAIDPTSGGISKVAGVATDPTMLRLSRAGTLGYAAYSNVNLATQLRLTEPDSVTTWSLGVDPQDGPYTARDIQPAPDSAQTCAVSFGAPSWALSYGWLVIYDNGTARPQRQPNGHMFSDNVFDTLQWGLTDSMLYAADNENTAFELYNIWVGPSGATSLSTISGVLKDFYLTLHFDRGTGYLYMEDGSAINPGGSLMGQYDAGGLVVPDSSINRVFFLGQTSSQRGTDDHTIVSYDQAHFTYLSSLTIRNLVGTPMAFTRWGASGFAIVTFNGNWGPTGGPAGMLYIIDNPTFVSATQQAQVGVDLTVRSTWQPGRSAVSTSRRSPRPADSAGKVFRPSRNR